MDFAPKGADTLRSEVLEDLGKPYEGNETEVDRLVARRLKDEEFKASLHVDKNKHLGKKQAYEEMLKQAGIDPETGKKIGSNEPVPPPAPTPGPALPTTPDMESIAKKVLIETERDRMLATLPEDKRESVKEIFTAITANKEVNTINLGSFLEASARAVGVDTRGNNFNKIISGTGGAVPPRSAPGPTKEQIEFAKKLGNDPEKVYGKEVDFSHMANAQKFLKDPTEN